MSIPKLKYIRQLIDELIKEAEAKTDSVGMSQFKYVPEVCRHRNIRLCAEICTSDYHNRHCLDCGEHLNKPVK